MKNKFKILYLFLGVTLLFTACSPDEYQLGSLLSKGDLQYSITPNTADPNMIILKSLTPGATPLWVTPFGRSNRVDDTVRIAFPGDYKFVYGVQSAGGFVQADTLLVKITTTNLMYVDDPMWTLLTGGPGNEKTWVFDFNADGVSKYFPGPLGFMADETIDFWSWFPTYAGNEWMATTGDYGTMTFSLKGGPFLNANHLMYPDLGVQNGTYFLDAATKKISFTNALPINNGYTDVDYTKGVIYSITEDAMQIAYHNLTKPEYCVLNYTTKEYSDNWTPPVVVPTFDDGFNPTFQAGEILTMLAGDAGQARRWLLDAAGNPVDWLAKGKGWTANKGSSETWGWNPDWDAAAASSWIQFDRFGGQNYTRNQQGTITTGTFTIDEATSEVTLTDNTLILSGASSWMDPTTHVLKIVKGWPTDYNNKGVWFGTSYDAVKDEWFVFHYVVSKK
jgi:hypothetical protein